MGELDESQLVEVWVIFVKVFNRLGIDCHRGVREQVLKVLGLMVEICKEGLKNHLKDVCGVWFSAWFDPVPNVASAARDVFEKAFKEDRREKAVEFCADGLNRWIEYSLFQAKVEDVDVDEDAQFKLGRLVGTGLLLLDMMVERNRELIGREGFWEKVFKLSHPFTRKALFRLIVSLCKKDYEWKEADDVARLLIPMAVESDFECCTDSMWEAIVMLSTRQPMIWKAQIPKKPLLNRLHHFLQSGCMGVGSIVYPCMFPIIHSIAEFDWNLIQKILESFWRGVKSDRLDLLLVPLFIKSFTECFSFVSGKFSECLVLAVLPLEYYLLDPERVVSIDLIEEFLLKTKMNESEDLKKKIVEIFNKSKVTVKINQSAVELFKEFKAPPNEDDLKIEGELILPWAELFGFFKELAPEESKRVLECPDHFHPLLIASALVLQGNSINLPWELFSKVVKEKPSLLQKLHFDIFPVIQENKIDSLALSLLDQQKDSLIERIFSEPLDSINTVFFKLLAKEIASKESLYEKVIEYSFQSNKDILSEIIKEIKSVQEINLDYPMDFLMTRVFIHMDKIQLDQIILLAFPLEDWRIQLAINFSPLFETDLVPSGDSKKNLEWIPLAKHYLSTLKGNSINAKLYTILSFTWLLIHRTDPKLLETASDLVDEIDLDPELQSLLLQTPLGRVACDHFYPNQTMSRVKINFLLNSMQDLDKYVEFNKNFFIHDQSLYSVSTSYSISLPNYLSSSQLEKLFKAVERLMSGDLVEFKQGSFMLIVLLIHDSSYEDWLLSLFKDIKDTAKLMWLCVVLISARNLIDTSKFEFEMPEKCFGYMKHVFECFLYLKKSHYLKVSGFRLCIDFENDNFTSASVGCYINWIKSIRVLDKTEPDMPDKLIEVLDSQVFVDFSSCLMAWFTVSYYIEKLVRKHQDQINCRMIIKKWNACQESESRDTGLTLSG